MRPIAAALALLVPLLASAQTFEDLVARDRAALDAWKSLPLVVTCRVVDEDGFGVAAVVIVGAKNATADKRGWFRFEKIDRHNALLAAGAAGFFTELRVADLALPASIASADLGTIRLRARRPGRARLVFGGDAMMGRRFLKPDNIEAPEKPLLRAGSLTEDAIAVLRDVAPFLKAPDLAILNLESVVTDGTGEPVEKSYTYWTPPEALDALKGAGVDALTLGNNHCWDYGKKGLRQTLDALSFRGLLFCGAGTDEAMARKALVLTAGGQRFALLSYSGIAGNAEPLQASGSRGGAAAMELKAIEADVKAAAKETPSIVALHSGDEYSDLPTTRQKEAASAAIRAGAALVIGHHPHCVQGLELEDGILIARSLGNFVFDQSRYATLPGILLVADFEEGRLVAARLVPIVNDDYRPRPAAGPIARWTARHVGALSSEVDVFWDAGGIEVALEGAHRAPSSQKALLTKNLPLCIAPVDPAAFVVDAKADGPLEAGRDLLRVGGFEDGDADSAALEGDVWRLTEAARISTHEPRSGAACLRLFCAPGAEAVASTRLRIPVRSSFTIAGWARIPAGASATVEGEYCWPTSMAPLSKPIVEGTLKADGPGWRFFAFEVDRIKKGGLGLRLLLRARGPAEAAAEVSFDDVAVIAWEPVKGPRPAPNEWDWLRATGPKATTAVTLELERFTKE